MNTPLWSCNEEFGWWLRKLRGYDNFGVEARKNLFCSTYNILDFFTLLFPNYRNSV